MAQYRGELTVKQTVQGMNGALRNAKRLLEDAKLLLKEKRYPSASSLAVLAIEEYGKVQILRGVLAAKDAGTLKLRWKEYRSHQSKNIMWIMPLLKAKGAKTHADLDEIFDPQSDHPKVLDGIKQLGFYSDCFGKCRWWEPGISITEKMAEGTVGIAGWLLEAEVEITEREMELWFEYLGDFSTPDLEERTYALYEALSREGIFTGSMEKVAQFLGMVPPKPE
jgi:AbiV family abortive infection protein